MADNIVVKIVSDSSQLKETNKVLLESGAISKETEKRFNELQNATTKVDGSFKSLRQQIKDAKTEAQTLSQQFGENSRQATQAAQKVANLTEELSDFNNRVKALNPEEKFNALNRVIGGTIGAFQGLTGALQLFGGESEEVKKIAEKLQGFLNLTQGLNSVIGLKDAFKDLRVVLTSATVAQGALTAANEAEAASATTAAAANKGLAASLGPIVLAIGAVVGLYYLWKSAQEEVAVDVGALLEQFDELRKNQELQLAITKEQGASEVELLTLRESNNKLYQEQLGLILAQAKEEKDRESIQKQINDLKREEQLLLVQITGAIERATVADLQAAQAAREKVAANQAALKAQFEGEIAKQEAKIDKQTNLNKKANEVLAADNQDRINRDLVAEIQGLEEKKELYKDNADKIQEIEIDLASARKRLRKVETDERRKQLNAEAELQREVAIASFDFITDLARAQSQNEIANLEEQKSKGIITEQEYQKRLKQIKTSQAKDEKAFAVFQTLLNIGVAVTKQLAATPLPAGAPFISQIIALGAIQLAGVLARPIPKFKRGTLNVTGGQGGEDDVLAYLNRGEAVIPTDRNRDYNKTISAIFTRSVSAQDLNNFVVSKTSGSGKLTATINPYDLARGMRKSKREIETQARLTGQVIAKELSSSTNIRHVI